MFARRAVPFIAAATFFPPPSAPVLFPNPLATIIGPLPARDSDRRHLERVLVTVLGQSVADDDARIADRPRDRQHFELALSKITEIVQIVHLIFDEQERVLGIVARCRRANDHAGVVLTMAGDVVRGGGVTTERSEIGNGICELALSL